MAKSDNFCSIKNQQLTGHSKPKNAQIWGFSTAFSEVVFLEFSQKMQYSNANLQFGL